MDAVQKDLLRLSWEELHRGNRESVRVLDGTIKLKLDPTAFRVTGGYFFPQGTPEEFIVDVLAAHGRESGAVQP